MSEGVAQRMRERSGQLRRMAEITHDHHLHETLLKMADEVELDADRLEAGAARRNED